MSEGVTIDGEIVPLNSGIMPWRHSRVWLDLPESMEFQEWETLGSFLRSVERSVMWWVGDWLRFGERRYGEMYTKAIEATGYSYEVLAQAKYVAKAYDFSSRIEGLGWAHHQSAASLPAAERSDVLLEAQRCGWSVRELKGEISRRRTKARLLLPSGNNETCTVADILRVVELGKKFSTIYADPPWQYDNQGTRASTEAHYSGLTVAELCSLPIKELASPSAHLHLWTTNGFLFECSRIFDAWGFEFKSSFVWVKPTFGIGNYWRNSHEFLLTGVRGDAKRFNDHTLRSWLECARGEHSAKPEQVRSYIERAGAGPRIELFGRREVKDWVVWGNDIRRELFDQSVEAA